MGLFFGKKKNRNVDNGSKPFRFESADSSDDSFLLSAVGGSNNDYFEGPQELQDKTRGYGTNSGLAYVNKYSSTNQKLATSKVVDIGAFKKPVKDPEKNLEPKPETPSEAEFEKLEPVAPDFNQEKSVSDSLLESEDGNIDDSDFDSFFDEFMKKTSTTEAKPEVEANEEQNTVEVKMPASIKKPSVPRKRKKGIDIDIISGGYGGDII